MEAISAAQTFDGLQPYAQQLGEKLLVVKDVLNHLLPYAAKGQYERFLSDATLFMEMMGTVTVAWQWLKMAVQAKQAPVIGDASFTPEFYESKILAMRFFFKYELPEVDSRAASLKNTETLTLLDQKELIC